MRLACATDLHLDHLGPEGRESFSTALHAARCDALLVTGDLSTSAQLTEDLGWLSEQVPALYFVLGNHDFYGSSIAAVRREVLALQAAHPRLRWLPGGGPVRLGPSTTLVGCDGVGDARAGDALGSPVELNDFRFIEELAFLPRPALRDRLQELGRREASTLDAALGAAVAQASHEIGPSGRGRTVIIATHVPPFPEACWHDGHQSDDDWQPFFTCVATGEVLRRHARANPAVTFTVLCGHTHSDGVCLPEPNLTVRTGGAVYGAPEVLAVLAVAD